MYLILLLNISIHACYIGSKVVIALLALDLGASQLLIGVLVACYGFVPMVLAIYAGRLADSIGMRMPMLLGALGVGAAMVAGFLWHTLPALFLVANLVAAGFVFFNTSMQNLVGAVSKPEHRARSFGMLSISYSLSSFIGPMIAGYSVEYAGHGAAFLIFAAFTLIPLAVLTFRGSITHVAAAEPPKETRSALDLLRDPPLRRVVIVSGLMVAAWELHVFYVPIFAHAIGLPASSVGLILGAYAAATFLIRFAMPAIVARTRVERVLVASTLVAACAFVIFPLLRDANALIFTSFVIGLGLGCGQPLSMTITFERSPAGRTGEVTGLRLIANNVARVAVPVLAGGLGTALGMAPVFWMNALNLVVASFLSRNKAR